jgi:hypothetical protein
LSNTSIAATFIEEQRLLQCKSPPWADFVAEVVAVVREP